MNNLNTMGALSLALSCGMACAGAVVDLTPGDFSSELSGVTNTQMSELIGTVEYESFQEFVILSKPGLTGGAPILYNATLMTRIVRSNESGNLHLNYMITGSNADLVGEISHVDISGFGDFQTRVEYRNEASAPGDAGPVSASRSLDGDIITYNFDDALDTGEESKFFFAMVNAGEYTAPGPATGQGSAFATIVLKTGESTTFEVASIVPAPGVLGLFSIAGLVSTRRRR